MPPFVKVECKKCGQVKNVYYVFSKNRWPKEWGCMNCGKTHELKLEELEK